MIFKQKWEYKELSDPTYDSLNAVGAEGWELVCITPGLNDWPDTAFLKRRL